MFDIIIISLRKIVAQKWKILFTIGACALFLFILFPFKDLNDFISGQVGFLTGNRVYLQFEDMHINPVTVSVTMDNVVVETSDIDGLNINALSASPSIAALLKRQPGGNLTAEGIFGGDVKIKLTPLEKLESGALKANVNIETEKVSLKSVRETLKMSLPITGSANMSANVTADMSFKDQPDGEVTIVIDNFELPTASVNTPNFGSISLPEVKFKQVDIKGKLANGKLTIDNAKLGDPKDDLSGNLKGDIDIRFENVGGQPKPVMGGYNLSLDLTAKPAFVQRAGFFLGFIDQFKRDEGGISRYRFKLSASNSDMPPSMTPLN